MGSPAAVLSIDVPSRPVEPIVATRTRREVVVCPANARVTSFTTSTARRPLLYGWWYHKDVMQVLRAALAAEIDDVPLIMEHESIKGAYGNEKMLDINHATAAVTSFPPSHQYRVEFLLCDDGESIVDTLVASRNPERGGRTRVRFDADVRTIVLPQSPACIEPVERTLPRLTCRRAPKSSTTRQPGRCPAAPSPSRHHHPRRRRRYRTQVLRRVRCRTRSELR